MLKDLIKHGTISITVSDLSLIELRSKKRNNLDELIHMPPGLKKDVSSKFRLGPKILRLNRHNPESEPKFTLIHDPLCFKIREFSRFTAKLNNPCAF